MAETKTPASSTKKPAAGAETAPENGTARPKKPCAISRADFTKHAKPLAVQVGGQTVALDPKEFKTGSFGYFTNQKVVVEINGVPVTFQANLGLTAVNSKERLD